MDVKGPIRLALEAQTRFEEAAIANKQLLMVSEAQEQVMGELLQSMPSAEETAKEIAAVEAACEKLDQQIKNGSQILLESLSTPKVPKNVNPGGVIKTILDMTLKVLYENIATALENGQTSVLLLHILDIEDQLSKLIQDMESRDMFPETEQQRQQRMDKSQAHNEKAVQFLELVKAASMQRQ